MTLRLSLIDDEGNVVAWDRPFIESLEGLKTDRLTAFWGNVALLTGTAVSDLEKGRHGTGFLRGEACARTRAAGSGPS